MSTPTAIEIGVSQRYTTDALSQVVREIEAISSGALINRREAGVEDVEKEELKRRYGWTDPRGLKCYSKAGRYCDIYAYFDYNDKTSPINEAATKAFKCYGLDGDQHGKRWECIRGKCVAVRAEPPVCHTAMSGVTLSDTVDDVQSYDPRLDAAEVVQTLMFFKNKDAATVARQRDIERTLAGVSGIGHDLPFYTNLHMLRTPNQVAKDTAKCAGCGISKSFASGKLRRCPCRTGIYYCDTTCQNKDWPIHKRVCSVAKNKAKN